MKRIFLTLFIFATAFSSVFAQDSTETVKEKKEKSPFYKRQVQDTPSFEDKKLTFALSFSPSFNSYRSREAVTNQRLGRRFAMNFGLNAEYHLSSTLSLLSGVNLVSSGGKFRNFSEIEYSQEDTNDVLVVPVASEIRYMARAVQIPVLARWTSEVQADDDDNFKFYGQAGFGLNFISSAKATLINDDADLKERSINIDNEYGNFDTSLIFGIGSIYDFNSKIDTYGGISFQRGLVDMAQNFDKIRFRSWTLDFGIIF